MHKRLVAIAVLLIATILIVNFINGSHHIAVFHPCPNTDYCSQLGRAQQGDPVRIEYSGWPFKVKIGNPDWCAQDACGVNNFHPDYMWEFLVYNAVILAAPTTILLAAYIYQRNRRLAKKLFLTGAVIISGLVLGWLTMFVIRSTVVWQTASQDIKSGIPFPSTLSIGYDCDSPDCAGKLFSQDTQFWHSEPRVYANWLFWSSIWVASEGYILKNYAHSRH